ncbi:MAG: dephospho-CoA kinase [Verrucomicrobiota bacterium]
MRVIGLTGGIASGKSSVARFFLQRKIPVIDADQLARDAVQPGSHALERIAELFGPAVLTTDGTLDRARVRELIFCDTEKRRQLEEILHPQIRNLAEAAIARAAAGGERLLIYMAPRLIEAGVAKYVDEVWVVTVRPEVQRERLMKRDVIDREAAERIIASQMPLDEKERHGRVVIDNSGTPQETERMLEEIWKRESERWK